ncbi:hypothetical protein BC826DRAFT_1108399 [Russula brevipes]|nr:hypothetical protein BC826DRAFT_1108399 [Russula brevipes]
MSPLHKEWYTVPVVVASPTEESTDADDDDETTATSFTHRLLKHFLNGFQAKDKNVCYRALCFIAEAISQLVAVLAKMCGSEDFEELGEDEQTAPEVLENLLAHDPSANVRRAALLNIPVTAQTHPAVLARTRDIDMTVRRLVYGSVLPAHAELPDDAMPGAAHPREQIVRNGFGDREPAVRAAAGAILEHLLAFLGTFDLRESAVVEDALLSVFVMRIDIFDALEFDGAHLCSDFFTTRPLIPVLFFDHCVSTTKENACLEKVLPVVTAHAFRVQDAYNSLLNSLAAVEETGSDDEVTENCEFVLAELLRLALNLDYADEIGERDLIRVVVEVVHELRDENDEDEVITFEGNSTLEGMLGELIAPAVKRKEFVFREKGLMCLGLDCLIRAAHGTQIVPAVPESDIIRAGGAQAARAASRI